MNGLSLIQKVASAVILGILLLLILIMARGNEDVWVCVAGKWAKHGNPAVAMPPASQCR